MVVEWQPAPSSRVIARTERGLQAYERRIRLTSSGKNLARG